MPAVERVWLPTPVGRDWNIMGPGAPHVFWRDSGCKRKVEEFAISWSGARRSGRQERI